MVSSKVDLAPLSVGQGAPSTRLEFHFSLSGERREHCSRGGVLSRTWPPSRPQRAHGASLRKTCTCHARKEAERGANRDAATLQQHLPAPSRAPEHAHKVLSATFRNLIHGKGIQSAVSSIAHGVARTCLPDLAHALRKLPPDERREAHTNASSCVQARARRANFGRFREEAPTGKWGVHGVPANRF